jgi:hypothetical protein
MYPDTNNQQQGYQQPTQAGPAAIPAQPQQQSQPQPIMMPSPVGTQQPQPLPAAAVQQAPAMPQMPAAPGQVAGGPAVPGQKPAQFGQPVVKSNPNSTQNTLEIAEVRDGIVIMQDGSFRAVVMGRSINFDLMSAREREGVEFGYQSFLNSLYFNIQIVMRSRKVDMRPYLEKLGKIRTEQDNMLLGMLMEDYIYYISQLVEQTNIMNKQFYIVIPYFPEVNTKQVLGDTKTLFGGFMNNGKKGRLVINEAVLAKAKTELQNRVQSVMNGLQQLGVQAAPLDTQELIELYYDVYNPDTATRQPLNDFSDLATVVVNKGEGDAPQPNLGGGNS